MPRWLSTLLLILGAVVVTWAMLANTARKPKTDETPVPTKTAAADSAPGAAPSTERPSTGEPVPTVTPAAPVTGDFTPIAGLKVAPVADAQPSRTIGSTEHDPQANPFVFQAKFSPYGASVSSIALSQYSTTVNEFIPLVVQHAAQVGENWVYPFAAWQVTINGGKPVEINGGGWVAEDPVTHEDGATSVAFVLTIVDGDDKPVLRIRRTWRAAPDRYDLRLTHTFENLGDRPLAVSLDQLGPIDLSSDVGQFGDKRNVVVGYVRPGQGDIPQPIISSDGYHLPRHDVLASESRRVFPTDETGPDERFVWAAMTNRYFAVAVHPAVDPANPVIRPLDAQVKSLEWEAWPKEAAPEKQTAALKLIGSRITLAPAGDDRATATTAFDVYAGPMDPKKLKKDAVYTSLRLGEVIVYNLGGFCAFCTFAWLADFLLAFLSFMHFLVRDWGLAIILLVAVVRLILHPLTKQSQVNMMKMSKQMQALQPEIQRLKEKYADEKEKLNTEMMTLYRERGVNPAAMGLGCLPMFLQMPIWFALYAMLYFAIELRHEPAFYDVFHRAASLVGLDWHFLSDLSSHDAFIPLPEAVHFTVPFLHIHFDAINLLPILMAFVFFLQQKYTMSATPPANEQIAQQQKIMKWMTMLFPIFLYNAPSGLTLYILTSTTVGIVESRRVRAHLKQLEDSGELFKKRERKPGGFMDRLQKKVEQRQRMIEQQQKGGPTPSGGNGGPASPGPKKKPKRGKGGQRF